MINKSSTLPRKKQVHAASKLAISRKSSASQLAESLYKAKSKPQMDVQGTRMLDMGVQATGPTIPDLDKDMDGVLLGCDDTMQDLSPILRQRIMEEEVKAQDISVMDVN